MEGASMNWGERIITVVVMVVGVPIGLVGILFVVGSVIEGAAHRSEQLDRCKRDAATPQEYHRCK